MKKLLILSILLMSNSLRADLTTNCASLLLTNVHNIEYVAYIKDNSTTNIYSDYLFIKEGTNFPVIINGGSKKLNYTAPSCDIQIWAESNGNTTKIGYVECSKLAVFNLNNPNFNLSLQITRDLFTWSDILVTSSIIKIPTDENMAFVRMK